MQVFYINLDSQPERRDFVEANFKAHNGEGWKITRVPAVDKATLSGSTQALPPVKPGELACFLSHLRAMDMAREIGDDILIFEDDALFGPNSQQVIGTMVGLSQRSDWDMLATDVCISDPMQMILLLALRRKQPDRVEVLDLNRLHFAGTTAYVINRESKQRVLDALKAMLPLTQPYDLELRRLCRDGFLRIKMIFPFATSLSCHAESSSIQSSEGGVTDRLWNAFRRLVWFDRDLAQVKATLEPIEHIFKDEETELLGKIVMAHLSPQFVAK
jgi:GR25 family glycosyltransferase involved in LPS biosynthesis